jgi:hypothetical protein
VEAARVASVFTEWDGIMPLDYEKLLPKGGLKGMTKQDYNAIVDAIGQMCDPIRNALSADGGAPTRQIIEIIAAQLGLVFARDNKDFDSFRFMEALNKRLARML